MHTQKKLYEKFFLFLFDIIKFNNIINNKINKQNFKITIKKTIKHKTVNNVFKLKLYILYNNYEIIFIYIHIEFQMF